MLPYSLQPLIFFRSLTNHYKFFFHKSFQLHEGKDCAALIHSFILIVCVWAQLLSCVQLFGTLWTVTCQAPLSIGFSRQEYWSELPFPATRDHTDPEIEPTSLASPALAGGFFTTEPPGKLYPCYLPTKSLANNRSSFRCWMDRWMDAWRRKIWGKIWLGT